MAATSIGSADAGSRFLCTPGGAIRRGRRRLGALFLGLSLLLVVVGGAAGWSGRRWPAIFALAVALVPWTAWRMSGDLDPLWLEIDGSSLVLQLRRRRERRDLAGVAARRLGTEEIAQLERLATAGGVAAGTGGFDSRLWGEFDLAASDLSHAVLLDWGESRLIVTPDEPQAFLAALTPGA